MESSANLNQWVDATNGIYAEDMRFFRDDSGNDDFIFIVGQANHRAPGCIGAAVHVFDIHALDAAAGGDKYQLVTGLHRSHADEALALAFVRDSRDGKHLLRNVLGNAHDAVDVGHEQIARRDVEPMDLDRRAEIDDVRERVRRRQRAREYLQPGVPQCRQIADRAIDHGPGEPPELHRGGH